MALFCPNENSPEFKEISAAFGRDSMAYHLWDSNKGNPIDKAPNGEDSILFETLLKEVKGDRKKAIVMKALVHTPDFKKWFGDWINDPKGKNLDTNGEPIIKDNLYTNSENETKAIDNRGTFGKQFSEQDILNYFIKRGILGKKKFRNNYWVKKGEDSADYESNIKKLEAFNEKYKEWNGLITLTNEAGGTTVKVNPVTLKLVNKRAKDNIYYQGKAKSKEQADSQLDQYLTKFLKDTLGVDVTVDELNRLGDSNAKADIMKKLITISKDRSKLDTLPEEVGHFFIEALPNDSPLKKKLIDLAKKTKLHEQVVEEYSERYNGDQSKLEKETAGKLIAAYITSQWKQKTAGEKRGDFMSNILDTIKKIVNKILNLFKSKDVVALNKEIELIYSGVANEILSGNTQISEQQLNENIKDLERNNIEDLVYDQFTDEEMESLMGSLQGHDMFDGLPADTNVPTGNPAQPSRKAREDVPAKDLKPEGQSIVNLKEKFKLKNAEKLRKEQKDALIKKLEAFYSKRNSSTRKFVNKLELLLNKVEKADADLAIFYFTKKAVNDINTIYEDYKKIKNGSEKFNSSTFFKWRDYVSGYASLETLVEELYDEDGDQDLINIIKDALVKKSKIEKMYKTEGKDVAIEFLAKHSRRLEITQKDELEREFSKNNLIKDFSSKADYKKAMKSYIDKKLSETEQERYVETKELLRKELDVASDDVTVLTRWIDNMLDSNDAVITPMIRAYEKSYLKTQRAKKKLKDDLLDILEPLEAQEGKNRKSENLYSFMVEKNDKGEKTQHFVTRFKSRVYEERQEHILAIQEAEIRESKDSVEDLVKIYVEWGRENMVNVSKEEYIAQYGENALRMDGVKSKDGYAVPKDKWLNPQYKKIEEAKKRNPSDPIVKYYESFVSRYIEYQDATHTEWMRNLLPQRRKKLFERVQGKDNVWETTKETAKTGVIKREDDEDKGQVQMTDESGNPINNVPVFFTNRIEAKEQSYDLTTLLQEFGDMALTYSHKHEILHDMELVKLFVNERQYRQTKKGSPITKFIHAKFMNKVDDKDLKKDAKDSELVKQFNDWFDAVIYGQKEKDAGSVNMFGVEIDLAKAANILNKYTGLNMLALNMVTGVGNKLLGEVMQTIESFAGEHYTMKDYYKAVKQYNSNLMGIIGDIGERRPTNKISLLLEDWDILNDYNNREYNKNTKFKRLMSSNTAYFNMHAGEHSMQTKVMLAMLNKVVPKDSTGKAITVNGKKVSMWDMIEAKDGKLEMKKGDGGSVVANFGAKEQADFVMETKRVLSALHGEYSQAGMVALQRLALGRMAMMFRKFIVPGIKRRWGVRKINEAKGTYTEGAYRVFGRYMGTMIKDLKRFRAYIGGEEWNALTLGERANIIRTIGEAGFLAMSMIMSSVFMSMKDADDDDDDRVLAFMAYQAFRLTSELQFFINVNETQRILRSPAAAVSVVENVIKFFSQAVFPPFTGWDRYERGSRKGQLKIVKTTESLIPFYKQWKRLQHIEDQLSFFSDISWAKKRKDKKDKK